MNLSELNADTEFALTLVQHVCGTISLLLNGSILLLIIKDEDKRNKTYRKYLCSLQIFSLAYDTFSDMYAPIIMIHKGLFYSDSILAKKIPVTHFLIIDTIFYVEVFVSYFACVFYRRGVVLANRSRLNLFGWKRNLLYLSLQVYILVSTAGALYLVEKSLENSERMLPEDLNWVRQKASHVYVRMDQNFFYASLVADQYATVLGFSIFAMLRQLIIEVKRGSRKASDATRRYQQLAVRSLILQGAVPGLVYLIPSFINTCLQAAPSHFQLGTQFDRIAGVLSPSLWIIMTKHTFANSLTILYCSPSYRRKISSAMRWVKGKYCIVQVSPMHSNQALVSISHKQ